MLGRMSREISVTAGAQIAAPVGAVFALAAGPRLPDFIKPQGALPGVAKVEGHLGLWSRHGETRRLTPTDGSSICEELTAIEPQQRFCYRTTGFSGPIGVLVREARGEWTFAVAGAKRTRVDWTYAFLTRGALAEPLAGLIAKALWPGYMRAALSRLKAAAEEENPSS